MEKYNIVIKFHKDIIESISSQKVILKTIATNDHFFTNFIFKSIVDDGMLAKQNTINNVNFDNLTGICYVENIESRSLEEKESIAQQMDSYDFVEYSYVEKLEPMQLPFNTENDNRIECIDELTQKTPYFVNLQSYKDGITDTHIGIDMEYAWSRGVIGQGIRIADIEWGFNFNHINLKRDNFIEHVPTTNPQNNEHGTAASGIMFAKDVGFGIKGMVHGADTFYGISELTHGRVGGIAKGIEKLAVGDFFVYEMQTPGLQQKYVPADFHRGVWDVTQEALKAGIIIIAAAGNGGENLDLDIYSEYRNRHDNGIIRVGAGNEFLQTASFSTYGSMVHLQGWGTWNVVTTGYEGLHNDFPNNNYTKTFAGTSSATPIVASAAIAIQSWYKEKTGKVLAPHDMRALLIETGTHPKYEANAAKKHIGPLPNVANAMQKLQQECLQLLADAPHIKNSDSVSSLDLAHNASDITLAALTNDCLDII